MHRIARREPARLASVAVLHNAANQFFGFRNHRQVRAGKEQLIHELLLAGEHHLRQIGFVRGVWIEARDSPLRPSFGLAARAGSVGVAANVEAHPVLGESVRIELTLGSGAE